MKEIKLKDLAKPRPPIQLKIWQKCADGQHLLVKRKITNQMAGEIVEYLGVMDAKAKRKPH